MNIYDLIDRMTREHKTIFDMPLRVTFYARVSTHKEIQLNSQENQVQTFTELIRNNANWTLVEGYIDTIRGESAVNRDNFQRMIADAQSNHFDLIVCKEISRFSRDLVDSISYTRKLFQNNVGVFFTSDNLCTIDRDSELRLGIMASIAQQEVARLSERVKFGHRKAIENGVVMGNSRIFGYVKKDGRLVIDKREGEMVRLIYELYATGDYSLRNISDELTQRGFLNHSGNPISHTTVKSIIQNPKNKGYYCGNKVKILDYRTKKQKFLPEEEWLLYKDETGETVPAIVSEDLWEKCNRMLSKRCLSEKSGNRGGKRFTSPLSGKVICAYCGKSYHHNSYGHSSGRVQRHWICQNKKSNAASCPSFAIKDDEMITILGLFFNEFISNMDKYINKYTDLYNQQSERGNNGDEISDMRLKITKLQTRKEKLLDLYTDDLITKEDFKERNDKLCAQISRLQTDIEKTLNKGDNLKNIIERLNTIHLYFSEKISENMSDTLTYELSKVLLERIIVNPVSPVSADIIFIPSFGDSTETTITRKKDGVSIGDISKKMMPILTTKLCRSYRPQGAQISFNVFLVL